MWGNWGNTGAAMGPGKGGWCSVCQSQEGRELGTEGCLGKTFFALFSFLDFFSLYFVSSSIFSSAGSFLILDGLLLLELFLLVFNLVFGSIVSESRSRSSTPAASTSPKLANKSGQFLTIRLCISSSLISSSVTKFSCSSLLSSPLLR